MTDESAGPTWARDMGQSTGGFEMVFSSVILSLIGLWLDRRLGWTPILTVSLAVAGLVGGIAAVYYRYRRDIAEIEAETAALRGRTPGGTGNRSTGGAGR